MSRVWLLTPYDLNILYHRYFVLANVHTLDMSELLQLSVSKCLHLEAWRSLLLCKSYFMSHILLFGQICSVCLMDLSRFDLKYTMLKMVHSLFTFRPFLAFFWLWIKSKPTVWVYGLGWACSQNTFTLTQGQSRTVHSETKGFLKAAKAWGSSRFGDSDLNLINDVSIWHKDPTY